MNPEKRCGYVAIVGKPNVGKSTLLNHLIGQKLCITSRKPQTTRHAMLGIKTEGNAQIIFVDTPGLHRQHNSNAVNRHMNRSAQSVLDDVDLILFLVEKATFDAEDEWLLGLLQKANAPVLLVVNKIDRLKDRSELLPFFARAAELDTFDAFVPVAALLGDYLDELESEIKKRLPVSEFLFDEDELTDKSERFLAAEIVREKVIRQLGKELPYSTAVEIEHFKSGKDLIDIAANIIVERDGQKAILIGQKGDRMRKIGSQARVDLEALFEQKVMLRLWVKVKHSWSNDERVLKSLGFDD